jgi:hypothetical protein
VLRAGVVPHTAFQAGEDLDAALVRLFTDDHLGVGASIQISGHSVQIHLAAYSRWCGDEVVDDAFAKAEQRLGQGLRAQSSAAYCRTACENLLNPCSFSVVRYSSTVLVGFLRLARCCRIAMQTRSASRFS